MLFLGLEISNSLLEKQSPLGDSSADCTLPYEDHKTLGVYSSEISIHNKTHIIPVYSLINDQLEKPIDQNPKLRIRNSFEPLRSGQSGL
jgi:hypothetical protein